LVWSRRWLGIDNGKAAPSPCPAAPKSPGNGQNDDHWRWIWRATEPIAGTIGEIYLAKTRKLPVPSRVDEAIRFHPACPFKGEKVPAMVALLRDIRTDEPCGIHRTALLSDGSDRDRTRGKAMLGRAAGAAIKICPNDELTLGLGLVEGVETGLAIISLGWRQVWAAGSAGAIAQFPILPGIEELTIFADRDGTGQRAARECARRWSEAGCPVTIRTPFGDDGDWCDVARM
jgi:putative DNA primase/helicase